MRKGTGKKVKMMLAAAVLCFAAAMTGCVPTEETVVQRGPDFSQNKDVKIDFVQLHNDTIETFGGPDENPYVFINDLSISGDNDAKTVEITAIAMDDTTKEEAEQFAAAAIRHANDSAVTQSNEYTLSTQESFGTFFGRYALKLTVRPQSKQEDPAAFLVNIAVPAGGEIPLNPDIETYEEEWAEIRDRYLEEAVPVQAGDEE